MEWWIVLILVVAGLLIGVVVMRFLSPQTSQNTDPAIAELSATTQALFASNAASTAHNMQFLTKQVADSIAQMQNQLHQRLSENTERLDKRLSENTGRLDDRLNKAAMQFQEVHQRLADVRAVNERVLAVSQDLASLQDILRAPKLRGSFGELMLSDLLSQILPTEHFSLQYTFKGGAIADAVIRLSGGMVAVDSKFPLENFERYWRAMTNKEDNALALRKQFFSDVKKHIDAIATKYIRPEEGTLDFALMYIPAENVYYEMVIKPDGEEVALLEYLSARKIVAVSPNSFYAYLRTILLGLKGMRIEERAKTTLAALDALGRDYGQFEDEFRILGKHLGNATAKYQEVDRKVTIVGERFAAIADGVHGTATPNVEADKVKDALI